MYDLIIIGAGPGGYIAAERAGRKGRKVLMVEKGELGGVCLNEGCIPTKTLLNSAKRYEHAGNSTMFGVHSENVKFSMAEAQVWKQAVIETQRNWIGSLMKQSGVEVIKGNARFKTRNAIEVSGTEYEAKNILIATGSSPSILSITGADSNKLVTSTELLKIQTIPARLAVIGGGVIGMEFASLFSMLGTEVHVIEMLPEIIPVMEPGFAKNMRKNMKKINFHLSSQVQKIDNGTVFFIKKEKAEEIEVDLILMAAGRKPNTEGLSLKKIGVAVRNKFIAVNDMFQTSVPGIYAIGDVTGLSLFAHSASRMGESVIDIIDGTMGIVDFNAVPWVVYTQPEAAGCGLTESDAKKEGYDIVTAQVQMRYNGRFLAENGNSSGLCKVIAERETGEILGVHLLGGVCSEMIYGAAFFVQNGITIDEILNTIFPHPSVSEVIRDAVFKLSVKRN